LPIFGIVDIASPWIKDRAFARSLKEAHETLANLLIVASLHAAAALAHSCVRQVQQIGHGTGTG
jgi:cytochrome b561